jgi:acyl-CoA synthetase (AMP-forming)/AMP-acid ligase II
MNIIELILKNAARFPDKPAIVFDGSILTYEKLIERIRKTSCTFKKIGVSQGTFIGLLLRNSNEFVISSLPQQICGASIVQAKGVL